jgi:uncharacterized membrane protein
MDFYSVFKLLHVITAIAWVGGGLILTAMAIFNIRDHGPAEAIRTTQQISALSMRWFLPASALTFVFGAIVTTVGGLWSEAWVVLGLVGFAATFLTGYFVLRVRIDRTEALAAEGRADEATTEALALLRVSKFDYTVILLVVADMVLKPSWTDFATLGTFAAILVAGAVYFLVLEPRRPLTGVLAE